MVEHFPKALVYSVLVHLLLIALFWFLSQPQPVNSQPAKTINAYMYQSLPVSTESAQTGPIESVVAIPQHPELVPAPVVPSEKKPTHVEKQARRTAVQNLDVRPEEVDAQGQITNTLQTKTNVTNSEAPLSLAERSLAFANKRQTELNESDLIISQQRPEFREPSITTVKPRRVPKHVASHVQAVLPNGSMIEKIGDYCYLAKDGANLRSDISSMKPVPCGEDKNKALYDRIMSQVGQYR